MKPLLEVRDLDFAYGDVQVLRGVSLAVNAGEIVTLVGSNGAGKSTTLRNVSRLVRPRSGTIVFDGQDLVAALLRTRWWSWASSRCRRAAASSRR